MYKSLGHDSQISVNIADRTEEEWKMIFGAAAGTAGILTSTSANLNIDNTI